MAEQDKNTEMPQEPQENLDQMRAKNPDLDKLISAFDLDLTGGFPNENYQPPLPLFSFFKGPITNVQPYKDINLKQLLPVIAETSYLGNQTDAIRNAESPAKRNRLKAKLPFVTFAGTFKTRSQDGLEKISGYLVLDLDKVENVDTAREWLMVNLGDEILLMFTSPSGNGIKCVLEYDPQAGTVSDFILALSNHFEENDGPSIDLSGTDISRACFICHDPDAYLNPQILDHAGP